MRGEHGGDRLGGEAITAMLISGPSNAASRAGGCKSVLMAEAEEGVGGEKEEEEEDG